MFAASKTDSVATSGYQISRSLRFNSADSTSLTRTFTSAGNQKTWTWSSWVKKNKNTGADTLLSVAPTAGLNISILIYASNTLEFYVANSLGTDWSEDTSAVYRDPSAWYHVVLSVDTTQATAANRLRLYVNGVQQSTVQTYGQIPQNQDTYINQISKQHGIGRNEDGPSSYADFYLAEVYFIDGQALTPSSFGETNAQTGVWQPKAFAGTYGTNGFYLNFSDNSNTTAATLGKDYSGNGNNWTPNNFSVTAGAGNDSLVDSPTSYGSDTGLGGTVRGNYSTMNPLNKTGSIAFANGNLDVSNVGSTDVSYGTIGMSSGKWYWEVVTTTNASSAEIGIGKDGGLYDFRSANGYGYRGSDGSKNTNNTVVAYGATYTTNDVIGVALDMDAGTLAFYKNGTSQGTAFTGLSGTYFPNAQNIGLISAPSYTYNFGQRPFAYTAPSGFKALCTQNLPAPTIGATTGIQAGNYFNPVLYTGTGASLGVTGVGFQPDLVWVKSRSAATDHAWYDAVRGVQKQIESNNTGAETTETTGLTAFGSDGFTTGALAQMNTSSATYVAWNWKANGAGSSNTSGSITSTVSANTTSRFSVVTFTGTGANATIGHGLGVVPSMIIVKSRTVVQSWIVYHASLGNTSAMLLSSNASSDANIVYWNNTSPTSTVFSLGTNTATNQNGSSNVAYCFAEVAGYSKFGSYTGNGSTDGPFVFTGMRPAYVMIKRTDSASDWYIWDTKRDTYNVVTNTLLADTSGAETSATSIDDLSNGFKCRSATVVNASGGTYIYMAFAESPFKYSLAR
jgi:hypothetical protein